MKFDPLSPTTLDRTMRGVGHGHHLYEPETVARHPEYPLIAAHRNPYERVHSFYKHRVRSGNPPELKSLKFDEYIRCSCGNHSHDALAGVGWMRDKPIVEMLDATRVTHWLRFDRLEHDWRELATELGLELPKLDHLNASQPQPTAIYTQELADIVKDRMSADFDTFGYDTQSWQNI